MNHPVVLLISKFPTGFIFPKHFSLSHASIVHVPEVAEAEGARNSKPSLGAEPGSVPYSKKNWEEKFSSQSRVYGTDFGLCFLLNGKLRKLSKQLLPL